MYLCFLRFYEIFGVLVVLRLYEFSSFFAATRSSKFRRLHLKENPDIIVILEGLVVLSSG